MFLLTTFTLNSFSQLRLFEPQGSSGQADPELAQNLKNYTLLVISGKNEDNNEKVKDAVTKLWHYNTETEYLIKYR